jgi:hypothetical protein
MFNRTVVQGYNKPNCSVCGKSGDGEYHYCCEKCCEKKLKGDLVPIRYAYTAFRSIYPGSYSDLAIKNRLEADYLVVFQKIKNRWYCSRTEIDACLFPQRDI